MSYYNSTQHFETIFVGKNVGQFLTTEFDQKRRFCTLLTKVFSPKNGSQKYTFFTLLTTTVLNFGQNDSFPLVTPFSAHCISDPKVRTVVVRSV